jgi:hypothetical protein
MQGRFALPLPLLLPPLPPPLLLPPIARFV